MSVPSSWNARQQSLAVIRLCPGPIMAAKTSETRALTRHCDRVEPDEQEMRLFHLWIESLCDSDHDMSSELAASFRQVCVPNHRRSALCCLQQADKRTCWEILQQTVRMQLLCSRDNPHSGFHGFTAVSRACWSHPSMCPTTSSESAKLQTPRPLSESATARAE